MPRRFLVGLAVTLALAASGCGGDDSETSAGATTGETETAVPQPVTVELAEANRSGYTGTATLTPREEGSIPTFEAVVTVTPTSDAVQLVAIHEVRCSEYDPDIPGDASTEEIFEAVTATSVDELGEVREGEARATVPGSLAERTTGEYALFVHESAPPFTPVACGDIPTS
jgi:hypothetical protein